MTKVSKRSDIKVHWTPRRGWQAFHTAESLQHPSRSIWDLKWRMGMAARVARKATGGKS